MTTDRQNEVDQELASARPVAIERALEINAIVFKDVISPAAYREMLTAAKELADLRAQVATAQQENERLRLKNNRLIAGKLRVEQQAACVRAGLAIKEKENLCLHNALSLIYPFAHEGEPRGSDVPLWASAMALANEALSAPSATAIRERIERGAWNQCVDAAKAICQVNTNAAMENDDDARSRKEGARACLFEIESLRKEG